MGKIAIGYYDYVKRAISITADAALATLPAVNVGTEQISEVWQTASGTTTGYVLIDFGLTASIGLIAAINVNLTASATWRVRLSTVDATGAAGDAYDSTAVNANVDTRYKKAVLVLTNAVSGRYLRIDFDAIGSSFISIGRIVAMVCFKPEINFASESAQLIYRDLSKRYESDSGEYWFVRKSFQRGISFILHALTETEKNVHISDLFRITGTHEDVCIVLDRASTNLSQDTYYGVIDELQTLDLVYNNINSIGMTVLERL